MHARPQRVTFAEGAPQQIEPHEDVVSSSPPARPDLCAAIIEPMPITVPLSSVPPETLEIATDQDKARLSRSSKDSGDTTVISSKTGRLSQLLASERAKAAEVVLRINRPRQVTGRATKYHTALAWAGRVGWVGKAVVYAMIGGLACDSAVGDSRPDPNLPQTAQISASPQGAFVLLGTTGGDVDIVILLVMMVALCAYITWRFWEGLSGQGYDETISSKKNFFKFRVSPIVSGAVYISYLAFLISLLDTEVRGVIAQPGAHKEGWPDIWRYSAGGRVGLALLGIAFIIATCIQLQGVLTRQWHKDYRSDLPMPLMLTVFTIGHFGFAGRAGAFLAMAVLFFKDAGGVEDVPHDSSMVANALLQLQANRGLRAILMIVGILLITYGLFAVLSAFTRMFPTPPPSRRKVLPAAEFKEQRRQHKWGLPLHRPHPHANGHQATSPNSSHAGNTGDSHSVSNGNATAPHSVAMPAAATVGQQSGAASFPQADASPGWGKDQGLSRVSPVLQDSDGNENAAMANLPQSGTAAGSSSGVLVLPSQRGLAGAAAPAGPAAQQLAAAAPASGGGCQAGSAEVHRQQERGFVTIDL